MRVLLLKDCFFELPVCVKVMSLDKFLRFPCSDINVDFSLSAGFVVEIVDMEVGWLSDEEGVILFSLAARFDILVVVGDVVLWAIRRVSVVARTVAGLNAEALCAITYPPSCGVPSKSALAVDIAIKDSAIAASKLYFRMFLRLNMTTDPSEIKNRIAKSLFRQPG